MIKDCVQENNYIKDMVAVINNNDAIRMYTLLDLDNKSRRLEYIELIDNEHHFVSARDKITNIKNILAESNQKDRSYLSYDIEGRKSLRVLGKKNIFSIFSGVDLSYLTEISDDSEESFCDQDIVNMFFESSEERDSLSSDLSTLEKYPPREINSYRTAIFRDVLFDIERSVDGRDDFIWPISVSNSFCFNEPKERLVHKFSVASFFFRPSVPRGLSEYSLRCINIAEHDAIVKLARLTGLNVILIDVDSVVMSLIHYKDNEVVSAIVNIIKKNNNSIVFFKKSNVFDDLVSLRVCEEISKKLERICLKKDGIGYNYIVISNLRFFFSGSFRTSYETFFQKNTDSWGKIFKEKEGVSLEENDIKERENFIKESLLLSVKNPEDITETLDSIIGIKEARDVIGDIIAFHKKPESAKLLGVNLSSGILLTGDPGTGKTVVARAMAKELDRKVIMITGSDFSSHRYGDAISKVKLLFEIAREIAPCIVFIDEIDGIGNRENDRMHPEERRVVNKFLSEMSEKTLNDGIVFIGATNNPKEIDKAIVRDGRFDKKVVVNMPSLEDRKQAFEVFLGKRPVENFEQIDFEYFAMKTSGMTIAAIENIVNQSAIIALRNGSDFITDKMVEQAILDNIAGGEMSKRKMKPELLKRIAYHEAGHAVIGYHLDVGEIGGVSIIPRANALGMVFFDVDDDRLALSTEDDLSNQMMVALAGRASEAVFMGNISTGAAGDLEACTKIALGMIQNYGMGDSMVYSYKQSGFDGDIPADLRGKADALMKNKYNEVLNIIKKNKPAIEAVAEELIAREVISGKEFIRIIKGE